MLCYFCKNNNFKSLSYFKKGDSLSYRCKRCGLVHLESKENKIKDIKKYYSLEYYPKDYIGRKEFLDTYSYRFNFIDKYFPKPCRVLEVGAGSGDFLSLLKKRGYDTYGIDLSERAVGQAKKNYNLDLFCGTLDDAKFDDNHFDVVVMYHVLEHLEDPMSLLNEVNRVLKPKGILLAEVPHPTGFDARFSKKAAYHIADYPNHLYLFPPKTIKKMLFKSNFKTEEIATSFSFLTVNFIRKILSFFNSGKKRNDNKNSIKVKNKTISLNKSQVKKSFFYFFLKKIFSGMKITIIAQKND